MIADNQAFGAKVHDCVWIAFLAAAVGVAMLHASLITTRMCGAAERESSGGRQAAKDISAKETRKVVRTFTLERSGPPLTRKDIEAFEREIGGRLPDDYKDFMLAHNGGFPRTGLTFTWKGETETLLAFEELTPRGVNQGLRGGLRYLRGLNPVTADGFVPIAGLGHNYICLAVRGKVGAVFHTVYTDKTVYEKDLVSVDVRMEPLARSFTEFLESLTEIPPPPYCRIEDLGKRGTAEDLAKFLAEGNSINAVGRDKQTLVCEAVTFNNMPMIRECIKRGASLSGTLHAAVNHSRTNLIEMLVKAGANINERDEHGSTPLGCVVGWGLPGEVGARKREVRDLLIKLGAVE